MKKLFVYYNFIIATTFVLLALFNAQTLPELATSVLFAPVLIYFTLLVLPRENRAAHIQKEEEIVQEPIQMQMPQIDVDRRLFLKLIASGSASLFLFTLFSRKTADTFFGSTPKKETDQIKDPTDGYQITELDDFVIPTYYGYINKDDAWFIRKEDANGAFRYAKGSSNFAANWSNRASLRYDYFNSVF